MIAIIFLVVFFLLVIFILIKDLHGRIKADFISFSKCPFDEIYPKVPSLYFGDQADHFKFSHGLFDQYQRSSRQWFFSQGMVFNCMKLKDAEKILSSPTETQKGIFYDIIKVFFKGGLLNSNGDKWFKRRRIITPTFHFNILQQFYDVFRDNCKDLVKSFNDGPAEVDLNSIIASFTLNIICETAMGVHLEDNSESKNYRNSIHKLGELYIHRLFRPWLYNDFMNNLIGQGKDLQKAAQVIEDFTSQVVKARRNSFLEDSEFDHGDENIYLTKKKRYAMLDSLLKAEKNGEINDEGIKEQVNTFIFAGHDTVSVTITFTLFVLAQHLDVQERILNEFNETKTNGDFKMTDLIGMQYFDRVIKECQRLYPAVPIIARQLSENFDMNGLTLQKGTIVRIFLRSLCRDPEQFPDPEKFDPDRFLPENVAKRHPFSFILFSAGPRNCIGQKFALLEVKTVVLEILKNFVLLPITKPEEIVFNIDMVLRTKDPIQIRLKCRELIS